eukprot:m.1351 g.1351  ORF g.1351 m.1351 type:complete len:89 (-) comp503_c0_seq1:659-925(-)
MRNMAALSCVARSLCTQLTQQGARQVRNMAVDTALSATSSLNTIAEASNQAYDSRTERTKQMTTGERFERFVQLSTAPSLAALFPTLP